MISRRPILAFAAGWPALIRSNPARSQSSSGPIRIILGYPPGGGLDVSARILAGALRAYSPNVVVENKAGAGGRIAAEFVKNSEADGSTILFTPDLVFTIFPHIYNKLPYSLDRDFTAVSPFCSIDYSITVGPGVPDNVKTIADYATWVKKDEKNAKYGTPVAGGTPHFIGVMLARELRLDLLYVSYKGGAPLAQDLLGGHIPMAVQALPEAVALVKSGRVRSLATTGAQRSASLPDVPTLSEAGFAALAVSDGFGAYAPKRTPPEVVLRLADAIAAAARIPEVQQSLSERSFRVHTQAPGVYEKDLKRQFAGWKRVIEDSGFKAEQ